MPLPPHSAAGSKEGAGCGAKRGGANAAWLPRFFGRRSAEACPSSESSEFVPPRAASPGAGPHSQHALRSPSFDPGPVPSSGSSCATAAACSSERATSSCLAGGPGSVDNPCFSSRELAALQLSDWEIKHEEIQILKRPNGSDWRLGSGGFGTVFKAMRNGVQPVAVKILGTGNPDVASMVKAMTESEFAREISILRACRDTNILQFQGACFQDGRTLLITEYMEGGNLTHNLRSQKVCWWRRGKKVALDVARALAYLHSRRIVHLDIKSANVLLTRDGTAKVGDVGMARIMSGDYVSGVVGTLAWSAPELLMGQRCTTKADIYSFGVVLWEICTGELPVRGQLRDPRVPEECSAEVVDVLYRCLRPEPGGRPTATELVELLLNAPSTPPASAQPSTLDVGAADTAAGGALDSGDRVLAQQAHQQAQQRQRAQRQGQQAQRSDGGGAALSGDLQMALSHGGPWLSGGTLASLQSQVELEEELVAELVAESAPNSSGVSVGRRAPLPGSRNGAGSDGGLQRRLVLPPPGSLMSASPFAAPYEQSPGCPTPFGQSLQETLPPPPPPAV